MRESRYREGHMNSVWPRPLLMSTMRPSGHDGPTSNASKTRSRRPVSDKMCRDGLPRLAILVACSAMVARSPLPFHMLNFQPHDAVRSFSRA